MVTGKWIQFFFFMQSVRQTHINSKINANGSNGNHHLDKSSFQLQFKSICHSSFVRVFFLSSSSFFIFCFISYFFLHRQFCRAQSPIFAQCISAMFRTFLFQWNRKNSLEPILSTSMMTFHVNGWDLVKKVIFF